MRLHLATRPVIPVIRTFSTAGVHPYDQVEWELRDVEITEDGGRKVFEQRGVEVPKNWSALSTRIVVSKYLYGDPAKGNNPRTGGRETSIRQLIDRVVDTITDWAIDDGYLSGEVVRNDDPSVAEIFRDELKWLLVNQYGAFNSPVWFNCGLFHKYGIGKGGSLGNFVWDRAHAKEAGKYQGLPQDHVMLNFNHRAARSPDQYSRPQLSACFILSVEDNLEDIMELARAEAMLFKYGSGCGTDLSSLRSTREKLSGGGKPSGPMSFLKVYDAVAGVIKSGGRQVRCLAGPQAVYTHRGPVTAAELAQGDEEFVVITYNPATFRSGVAWATCHLSGQKRILRVTTDKGVFEVSNDHMMILAHGQALSAGLLMPGMRLFSTMIKIQDDYVVVFRRGADGSELLHRMIAEEINGENIKGRSVHHVDENRQNNHPGNLKVMTQAAHASLHGKAAAAKGTHVFQMRSFPKPGASNPMHHSSEFWKSAAKSTSYREKQGKALRSSGRSRAMQDCAATQKMANTGWTLINAGYDIGTWDRYREAREKHIGRMADPRKVKAAIEDRFGSFDGFLKFIDANNHRVVSVEDLGVQDVYVVVVEQGAAGPLTPNCLLWSCTNDTWKGTGIFARADVAETGDHASPQPPPALHHQSVAETSPKTEDHG